MKYSAWEGSLASATKSATGDYLAGLRILYHLASAHEQARDISTYIIDEDRRYLVAAVYNDWMFLQSALSEYTAVAGGSGDALP